MWGTVVNKKSLIWRYCGLIGILDEKFVDILKPLYYYGFTNFTGFVKNKNRKVVCNMIMNTRFKHYVDYVKRIDGNIVLLPNQFII